MLESNLGTTGSPQEIELKNPEIRRVFKNRPHLVKQTNAKESGKTFIARLGNPHSGKCEALLSSSLGADTFHLLLGF